MIDNIKLFVLNKHKVENHIIKNDVIQLNSSFNCKTGEAKDYPKKGKDLNLDIGIYEKSASIKGSLHKYHNIKIENGNQNYDDFFYSHVEQAVRGLIKKYDIQNDTCVTNLEFGFNLEVEKDPKIILENNLLMNSFKEPNKNLKFLGKGDYKEFQKTDYSIKIYNKSKQFKLDTNILRVELKIIKKRFLQVHGIFTLEDLLNKNILKGLFNVFKSKIEGLMIIDTFEGIKMPEKDLNKLNKYSNPNYWIRLESAKQGRENYRIRKDCNMILKKYDLLKTKTKILEKLEKKFLELIETRDYTYAA